MDPLRNDGDLVHGFKNFILNSPQLEKLQIPRDRSCRKFSVAQTPQFRRQFQAAGFPMDSLGNDGYFEPPRLRSRKFSGGCIIRPS
jgi:hypothetical protein